MNTPQPVGAQWRHPYRLLAAVLLSFVVIFLVVVLVVRAVLAEDEPRTRIHKGKNGATVEAVEGQCVVDAEGTLWCMGGMS